LKRTGTDVSSISLFNHQFHEKEVICKMLDPKPPKQKTKEILSYDKIFLEDLKIG
jgi:hypothetical protein